MKRYVFLAILCLIFMFPIRALASDEADPFFMSQIKRMYQTYYEEEMEAYHDYKDLVTEDYAQVEEEMRVQYEDVKQTLSEDLSLLQSVLDHLRDRSNYEALQRIVNEAVPSTAMWRYHKAIQSQSHFGALEDYRRVIDPAVMPQPLWQYKMALNENDETSPIGKYYNDTESTVLGGTMWRYREGRLTKEATERLLQQHRTTVMKRMVTLKTTVKEDVHMARQEALEAIYDQRDHVITDYLGERAKILQQLHERGHSDLAEVLAKQEIALPTKTIKIIVNGNLLSLRKQPIITSDTTLIPVRKVTEALGAQVSWDNETKTVGLAKGDTSIRFVLNQSTAVVNGETRSLSVPPQQQDNVTFVPLRFVAETFRATVQWVPEDKRILLYE